ncbi:MAG: hypothetical protein KDH94_08080, partial [Coxiellaceae bacterium]|nr:hypothetical protein [Coxiellaceae bacterium]
MDSSNREQRSFSNTTGIGTYNFFRQQYGDFQHAFEQLPIHHAMAQQGVALRNTNSFQEHKNRVITAVRKLCERYKQGATVQKAIVDDLLARINQLSLPNGDETFSSFARRLNELYYQFKYKPTMIVLSKGGMFSNDVMGSDKFESEFMDCVTRNDLFNLFDDATQDIDNLSAYVNAYEMSKRQGHVKDNQNAKLEGELKGVKETADKYNGKALQQLSFLHEHLALTGGGASKNGINHPLAEKLIADGVVTIHRLLALKELSRLAEDNSTDRHTAKACLMAIKALCTMEQTST